MNDFPLWNMNEVILRNVSFIIHTMEFFTKMVWLPISKLFKISSFVFNMIMEEVNLLKPHKHVRMSLENFFIWFYILVMERKLAFTKADFDIFCLSGSMVVNLAYTCSYSARMPM